MPVPKQPSVRRGKAKVEAKRVAFSDMVEVSQPQETPADLACIEPAVSKGVAEGSTEGEPKAPQKSSKARKATLPHNEDAHLSASEKRKRPYKKKQRTKTVNTSLSLRHLGQPLSQRQKQQQRSSVRIQAGGMCLRGSRMRPWRGGTYLLRSALQ